MLRGPPRFSGRDEGRFIMEQRAPVAGDLWQDIAKEFDKEVEEEKRQEDWARGVLRRLRPKNANSLMIQASPDQFVVFVDVLRAECNNVNEFRTNNVVVFQIYGREWKSQISLVAKQWFIRICVLPAKRLRGLRA